MTTTPLQQIVLAGPRGFCAFSLAAAALASDFTLPSKEPTLISLPQ